MKAGLQTGAAVAFLPALAHHALGQTLRGALAADPHFFLLVALPNPSSLDSSYLFDARPLAMTASQLMQNYRKPTEPVRWLGDNGVSTWATELTAPLAPFRQNFSVINGVIMAAAFDGHDQNFNYLFTGDAFGGESFVPHLNQAGEPRCPLDAIQRGRVRATLNNTQGTVPLSPASAANLVASLRNVPPLAPSSSLFGFLRRRFESNGRGDGALSRGSLSMMRALDQTPGLSNMLSALSPEATDSDPAFVKLMAQVFRSGAARAAVLSLDTKELIYDTHDVASASEQPAAYLALAEQLATVFRSLRETAYDEKRSLLDVTTVLFSAEFGRTMRQYGKPVEATGTDHNTLSNSVLVGGKGIRAGLVIGASDFATPTEELSKAHLSLDAARLKLMGRPFDFERCMARHDLPEAYHAADYLGFGSVINTIYTLFGAPAKRLRLIERNGLAAPIVKNLLS